ncbi:MAG: hypothetical protein QF436_01430 [Candidatus Woesearchaeota archaeon]|jgi:hypothetical protein|nr:hypothetical protein [Candidatus Woesearchaeota archaeon]MDP7622754.1 hypothetical protein [Candidatus Woesearchaeota archaeon]HJN56665.1 hypothetical protein [Candidatus Woesearchaeota archaeon]|tara:strand:+ start:32383 stop:33162 length:780 start_codon:yes stop_codon:yes gene_type:complete
MKNFIKAIREINKTLNFFIFFESMLNAAIFFLVVYFLLSLVNLYPVLAVMPAAIYFFIRMYVNLKIDKRKAVEGKYEPLKEKLRTAADNLDKDNPVVNELQEDVIHDLKHVGLSSFIQTKNLSYKILASILLSFAIVFATTFNLYIVDLNTFLGNVPDMIENINPLGKRSSNVIGEVNESEDIYGKSKLAVLGEKQIDIKIKPVNYEINVRESGDVEQKQFDEIFPNEVFIEQSSALEEKIPEEEQELVKSYFNKLAKG